MASVLGKRKAPSGASLAMKPPTSVATKKAKKSDSAKSTKTAAAGGTKKVVAKPKRREQETQEIEKGEDEEEPDVLDAQEIFRRHFEAAFKPLPDARPKPKSKSKSKKEKTKVGQIEEESDDEGDDEDLEEDVGADGEEVDADEDDDEWSGLSGDDGSEVDDEEEAEENVVQVVDHSSSTAAPVASMSKRELKAFMSSKPPTQTSPKPAPTTTTTTADDATDENDKSNLANDLALQRLLSESHLLSRHTVTPFSNPTAASKTFASGKLRARQTDLRAQALAPGVKSLFAQDKMPMAMRKGMNAHAAGREAKRRRQAKENGIVLEREAPAAGAKGKQNSKRSRVRADRSVDGPGVGRMRGAQLTLSERDVRSIEGPVKGSGGGGGRRGRGGGRGGRR